MVMDEIDTCITILPTVISTHALEDSIQVVSKRLHTIETRTSAHGFDSESGDGPAGKFHPINISYKNLDIFGLSVSKGQFLGSS